MDAFPARTFALAVPKSKRRPFPFSDQFPRIGAARIFLKKEETKQNTRGGVAGVYGAASQHPGRFGLACFHLRDSCMAKRYMDFTSLVEKDLCMADPAVPGSFVALK